MQHGNMLHSGMFCIVAGLSQLDVVHDGVTRHVHTALGASAAA